MGGLYMLQSMGLSYILGVTGIILCILGLGKNGIFLRMLTRLCVAAVVTYGINTALLYFGLPYSIGINGWTILVMTLLGVPGVAAMYAVCIFL